MFKSKLTFFRWLVFGVIGLLALWMIGGNLLASHLEKEIEREIAQKVKELEEEYPDPEPNDSALKLEAILLKEFGLGVIGKADGQGVFKFGDYMGYHPDFKESQESKDEFENIKESLYQYINSQISKPNDEIEAAPQELQNYLESKADALKKIKNHVLNSELPKSKTRIKTISSLEISYYYYAHNLLDALSSHFDLANFQQILALDILEKQRQGKNQEARNMLEVSWKISQSLKKDGTLAGQLLALRIETFRPGVIRKVDNLSPYWQERLLEHDYYLSILRSLAIYSNQIYNNQRRKEYIERLLLTKDICLAQTSIFTSFYKFRIKILYNMLQLEFTQKILQVKKLAKQQGKWPDSFPNLDSKFCPDSQYVYQVSQDGTMTISLDKQPEWVKDRELPLTYSDRTPPKSKIELNSP